MHIIIIAATTIPLFVKFDNFEGLYPNAIRMQLLKNEIKDSVVSYGQDIIFY
jgi:hypothetical protein